MHRSLKLVAFAMLVVTLLANGAQAISVPVAGGWDGVNFNPVGDTEILTWTGPGVLRVTDGLAPGDTFTVSIDGGPAVAGSFFVGGPLPLTAGPFEALGNAGWTSISFASFEQSVAGGGLHSATVTLTSAPGGLPAALFFRVDAVPEPATTALGLMSIVGLLARRRRTV